MLGSGAGKKELAHRLSWIIHNGDIPKGMCVLHKCDVSSCVRPDHLFLGTKAQNSADMAKKKRSTIGEKHPNAKLTSAQVMEIYAYTGKSHRLIAMEYGITRKQVNHIKNGRNWRYTTKHGDTNGQ